MPHMQGNGFRLQNIINRLGFLLTCRFQVLRSPGGYWPLDRHLVPEEHPAPSPTLFLAWRTPVHPDSPARSRFISGCPGEWGSLSLTLTGLPNPGRAIRCCRTLMMMGIQVRLFSSKYVWLSQIHRRSGCTDILIPEAWLWAIAPPYKLRSSWTLHQDTC